MTTITRVYDSYAQASTVVSELQRAGVAEADISLLGNRETRVANTTADVADGAATGAGVGAAIGGGAGLLAGLGMLAIPGIGPLVAAGWFAATAAGAVGGAMAGGLVGALVDSGVSEADAHVYSEAVRRGGTMVSARTNAANEPTVLAIMDGGRPIDLVTRRADYEREGWTSFNPDAPADMRKRA